MKFATAIFICRVSLNVFSPRGGKKRLKGESSILSRFHFSSFSSFLGHVLLCIFEFLSAVIEGPIFLNLYMFQVTFFSFVKSRSLKIRSHVPSTLGPGKDGLTSTLGS